MLTPPGQWTQTGKRTMREPRMLDSGQFDLGQSGFIRLRPVPDLGQFELGQFDLGQFLVAQKFLHDLGQF